MTVSSWGPEVQKIDFSEVHSLRGQETGKKSTVFSSRFTKGVGYRFWKLHYFDGMESSSQATFHTDLT